MKKLNKAARIRVLLNQGWKVATIAKDLKISKSYVYNVQWKLKHTQWKLKHTKKKKPGRIKMDTPVVELVSREEATAFDPTPAKPFDNKPLSEILSTLDMKIAYLQSLRDYLVQE